MVSLEKGFDPCLFKEVSFISYHKFINYTTIIACLMHQNRMHGHYLKVYTVVSPWLGVLSEKNDKNMQISQRRVPSRPILSITL